MAITAAPERPPISDPLLPVLVSAGEKFTFNFTQKKKRKKLSIYRSSEDELTGKEATAEEEESINGGGSLGILRQVRSARKPTTGIGSCLGGPGSETDRVISGNEVAAERIRI